MKEENIKSNEETKRKPNWVVSLVAGAAAGAVADVTLYPLDTLKTRLQSKAGFYCTGGFRGVYKGIIPVLLGSVPSSAIFFVTYNGMVDGLKTHGTPDVFAHLLSACCGEVTSSLIRVPVDVVKQRKQTSDKRTTSWSIIKSALVTEGPFGLYRGFLALLLREVPFSALQFPLWEFLKEYWTHTKENEPLTPLQTALCGSLAGGVAAAVTTPLDVAKTQIMLAQKEQMMHYKEVQSTKHKPIILQVLQEAWRAKGVQGVFAGFVPRVAWITLGGFIYFGIYEKSKVICENRDVSWSKLPRIIEEECSHLMTGDTKDSFR